MAGNGHGFTPRAPKRISRVSGRARQRPRVARRFPRPAHHVDDELGFVVLPMPADAFVRVLHALSDGLTFLRFSEPEAYPDELIIAAFEALAGGR
jgi:hypothetical protein